MNEHEISITGGQVIKFSESKHDPFIDFLKGICIILVVFTHCLSQNIEYYSGFELWGRVAVPIFLIIQVFHIYKHGFEFKLPDFTKLWTRVFRPFLIVQMLIAAILLTFNNSVTLSLYFEHILRMGGYGPGEYYPWIYLQFAIIAPIIAPIFKRFNLWQLLVFFSVISQASEILYCLFNTADWPYYSLSFVRYIFLIYLGYILVTKGIIINRFTIVLSIISLVVTACFCFLPIKYEPFFFTNTQWKYCHWFCYFYISYLYLFLLRKIFDKISVYKKMNGWICYIGSISYDIFLFQMFYFVIIQYGVNKILLCLLPESITTLIFCRIASFFICIIIPLLYKKTKDALTPPF